MNAIKKFLAREKKKMKILRNAEFERSNSTDKNESFDKCNWQYMCIERKAFYLFIHGSVTFFFVVSLMCRSDFSCKNCRRPENEDEEELKEKKKFTT